MNLTGASIIGFSRARAGTKTFRAFDPAAGREIEPVFFCATSEEVERSAQLAAEAFATYGRLSGKRRADLLQGIAAALEEEAAAVTDRANLETALPGPRLRSELARTCFQLRLQASIAAEGTWADARIDHADASRKPLPKPDVRSVMRPLGPVVVFGAGNFPLAFSVAGGDTAAALAAGNPVIVKAHPAHPGTSELVGLIIQQAVRNLGLPEGVFSLLLDAGFEAGTALVRHPLVRAVGFTGSHRGGRALMDLAASRPVPIPVYAEMGSVNPVFVLPEALSRRCDEIAGGLHASVTLGIGQFCTNPGLVFAQSGAAMEKLLEKLAVLMASTQPGPMLSPGICRNYRQGVELLAQTRGVVEVSSVRAQAESCAGAAALFRTAARTFLAESRLAEEVFGPSSLVVECGNRNELLEAARALEGQLTATVHGTEADLASNRDLLAVLETKVGRVIINGFPTGVEVCHAMVHGGPYPATSDCRTTSVGGRAIARFARPVCYQDFPDEALPDELKEGNPLGMWRIVDGLQGKH